MAEPGPGGPGLVGTQLGPFRVEAVLGRGGTAALHRALDTRSGRRVALKVHGPATGGPDRFEAEARGHVVHDHVVPLLERGEADGHRYLVLPLVEGPDLAACLGGRPLAPARALRLVGQVAEALDAVHAAGLVHLDVKPSNVLVRTGDDGAEHAWLADFGLARGVGERGADAGAPGVLGSPAFAAPEHLAGGVVDARTDLYSLTCVLFAALTGHAPYRGTVADVLAAHRHGPVPPTGFGAALDAVVRRGLAVDPAGRPGSGRELVDAARAALASPEESVVPVDPVGPVAPAVPPASTPWAPPVRLRDPVPPAPVVFATRVDGPWPWAPWVLAVLVIGLVVLLVSVVG